MTGSLKGTVRMLYEDALWFLGRFLFLYITLPLTVAWIIIGTAFELENAFGSIPGPAYFFIAFYGVMGYKGILPIATGLGSTRTQILKTFYGIGTFAVVILIVLLNLCQWLLASLYESGISSAHIMHPGMLIYVEYHFLSYLWIDLMIGLFLFGVTFLLTSIIYRLGMTRALIGFTGLGIAGLFLYYSKALDGAIELMLGGNLFSVTTFTTLGIIGLISLLMTYPLMQNAPLIPKGKNE